MVAVDFKTCALIPLIVAGSLLSSGELIASDAALAVSQGRVDLAGLQGKELVVRLVGQELPGISFEAAAPLLSLLGVFVGWMVSIWIMNRHLTAKMREENRQATREQNRRDAARIEKKLDGFYRPYMQLSDTNKTLRDALSHCMEEKGKFSLLIRLLDGYAPIGNAKTLVDEIARIGHQLAEVIATKSGHVNEAQIQKDLSEAAAHFRILFLAHKGKLSGQASTFTELTYPKKLDRRLRGAVSALENDLRELRRADAELGRRDR